MLQGSKRGRGGYRIRQRDDDTPLSLAARVDSDKDSNSK